MKKLIFLLFLLPIILIGQDLNFENGERVFKSSVKVDGNDTLKIDTIAYLFNESGGAHLGMRIRNANLNFDLIAGGSGVLDLGHHYGFGWLNDGASQITFKLGSDTNAVINVLNKNADQFTLASNTTFNAITSYTLPAKFQSYGQITIDPNYSVATGNMVLIDGDFRVNTDFDLIVLGAGEANLMGNTIRIKGATNRVGINDASPSYDLDVTGIIRATSEVLCDSTITIGDFIKLTPQASAPGTPSEGWIYMNGTDHHLYVYNGSTWVQLDN